MKVIFLGTPEFAKTCLHALHNSQHHVVAAVCRIDKPTGRGNKITFSPVKEFALQNNIPVYQFKKIRTDGVETLKNIDADVMVTASFGQILSQEIIDICPHKVINVHGSLLPKYRGASPISFAIINGETETGISIMQTDAGVDTGPWALTETVVIEDNDTYDTLSQKLADVGAHLIVKALDMLEENKLTFIPQDESKATFTTLIKKENALLNFNQNAIALKNLVRGLNSIEPAYLYYDNQAYKVFCAKPIDYIGAEKNGTIIMANSKQGLVIKCEGGALEIVEIQAPSGKKMLAKSYLNGKKMQLGVCVNE